MPTDAPTRDEPAPKITLMGGANFSTRANLKWTRGATHIAALESSFLQ